MSVMSSVSSAFYDSKIIGFFEAYCKEGKDNH